MKKTVLLLLLILFFPAEIRQARTSTDFVIPASPARRNDAPLGAIDFYKELLSSRGISLEDQGVLVETFDEGHPLAEHNADSVFNPASVMKLATSFAALSMFGPDHRYRTNFLIDGLLDKTTHRLEGDLVVEGGCDPMFSTFDAQEVASALARAGVARVAGNLRMSGAFYYFARGYHSNLSRETSALKLRQALQRAGIRIEGQTVFGQRSGDLIVAHYSDQLTRLLLYQNAFSSNAIAEVVGESVGGPEVIQHFLVRELGLPGGELYIGRASGLEFNRMTPRTSLKVMRAMIGLLEKYSLRIEDVMPVAGVDAGTLKARLMGDVRASVIAKTGTLASMDGGVSSLVGIVCTRERGRLLFAVFNTNGSVNVYRRFQDHLVEEIIREAGGPSQASRTEDALAQEAQGSITQILP